VARALMVSSLWPPTVMGGAELYASELAGRLRNRGWEIGVVTLGVRGPDVVASVRPFGYALQDYAEQSTVRRAAFHVADLYRPETHRVLGQAIRDFEPSVVHTHGVVGLSTAALTTPAAAGIPHVHSVHDHWLMCQRATRVRRDGTPCETICTGCSVWSGARNALLRRHGPSALLVGSEDAAAEHAKIAWTTGRLRVVPPPVPEAPREVSRPTHERTTFGYLGRLDRAKGVATLVSAFRAARLDARLRIGGTGPLLDDLRDEVGDADIEVLGWVDAAEKETFFRSIDCLVVPSECRELAGLVVLEARARRIPVIGADIGGIPELVPEESQPLLFRPGDRSELACRLRTVTASPDRFVGSRAGAASTWEEHLDAVEAAYAETGALPSRGGG